MGCLIYQVLSSFIFVNDKVSGLQYLGYKVSETFYGAAVAG